MSKTTGRRKSQVTSKARRAKLTADESLKRMRDFNKRKEDFVAAVRKGKDRSISA
jgi:hypothetical protein